VFTVFSIPVPAAMGAESVISMQPTSGTSATVVFEIAVLPYEAEIVSRMLQANGFNLDAVHNHQMGLTPTLFFIHGSTVGDPLVISRQIRRMLDLTRSAGSQLPTVTPSAP